MWAARAAERKAAASRARPVSQGAKICFWCQSQYNFLPRVPFLWFCGPSRFAAGCITSSCRALVLIFRAILNRPLLPNAITPQPAENSSALLSSVGAAADSHFLLKLQFFELLFWSIRRQRPESLDFNKDESCRETYRARKYCRVKVAANIPCWARIKWTLYNASLYPPWQPQTPRGYSAFLCGAAAF
jgi:hypothetical protein